MPSSAKDFFNESIIPSSGLRKNSIRRLANLSERIVVSKLARAARLSKSYEPWQCLKEELIIIYN